MEPTKIRRIPSVRPGPGGQRGLIADRGEGAGSGGGGAEALGTGAEPTLGAIFSVFFRIGLLSFGGGLSGWVYREVVMRKRWLTDEAFLSGMALGQVLPGANVANLAVYVGQHLRGAAGAATALFALLVGPFLAVIALLGAYGWLQAFPLFGVALQGVAAAAIGLLLLIAVKSVRHASQGMVSIAVIVGTFVAIAVFRPPLVPVALCAGILSVSAQWWRAKRGP
jgi:chromate transporter